MSTASNLTLIETKTAGSGGVANFDFTGITADFTDLQLIFSLRTNSTVDQDDPLTIAFNNSTTNFTSRALVADGVTSGASSSSNSNIRVDNPSSVSTANVFSNGSIYIPNYAGSNYKTISTDAVSENNTNLNYYTAVHGHLWSNTAAITSIKLSPVEGTLFVQNSTVSLYGIKSLNKNAGPKATGGIITLDGGYAVHTFFSSGAFTPTANLTNVEYLVIAGGAGGGGGDGSGGGGAGGYRTGTFSSMASGTAYPITVGAGGKGAAAYAVGSNGSDSVFNSITSVGGGGGGWGGNATTSTAGNAGGSGGGGGGRGSKAGGAATSGQGYAGGTSAAGDTAGSSRGGGGGGAGAVGGNGTASTVAGNGGTGIASSITGTSVVRAGGGAGGGNLDTSTGAAATGGSGGGGNAVPNGDGLPGTSNTGGGGAGGSYDGKAGGNGGSGIVIVRYAV